MDQKGYYVVYLSSHWPRTIYEHLEELFIIIAKLSQASASAKISFNFDSPHPTTHPPGK